MTVLVAGGTGRLGSLVVGRLMAQGVPVRVLTRDPVRARSALAGAEVIEGDVGSAVALRAAMQGATVAVAAVHGFASPGRRAMEAVDRDGNRRLIDAARDAGTAVVLMSVVGASSSDPIELFRRKAEAEAHLASTGGGTVVRATAFLELWIDLLARTAGGSARPLVFGRGRNPINFVSVGDVAGLVAALAVDGALRGRTIEIGGPRDLTFDELALLVATRLGGSHIRHLPRTVLRIAAGTVGLLQPMARRQLLTALAMDTEDLRFPGDRSDPAFDGVPCSDPADVVARLDLAPVGGEVPVRR
ncbi:SDR family oxidoreductase [Amnibacterium sp.]|uniref:SDR family oxidoreductase n=1 Tax=Amnibacterium sp. TaxID=1872496 RepID=UPI002626EB31|nr:NAD(P)H-binding protein [Amnibacterium sp.]MCU1474222.1 putative nucleoside-diphosphate-sugar epimerase [Amnibacterium sp.]